MGKLLWLFISLTLLPGCKRQDTECLSRIGKKIVAQANSATADLRARFADWKGQKTGLEESLEERVQKRLRWEKVLADVPIEVVSVGKEIELKGLVQNAEQREKAITLAESTLGVERVIVSLQAPEPPKKEE
ncbi:MAG: BON domain-containing protein [Gemmataceae bacterium]|nr:BON domain-containing protein [Gemmataceae bacterium]MCI0738663.1 BON domain-containing protein [Gemmataceae bacterium]